MFVALDLPDEPRAAIAAWRDGLVAGRPELRPVAAEMLHVTLVFLGWQDESAAEGIASCAFRPVAELERPLLAPSVVRPLPPRRPRLFALELLDEGKRAVALQAAMAAALADARFYRPEKRPFWPHLTLARVKRGARASPLPDSPPPGESFSAGELTLYRSTLRPQGALYEPLLRHSLPAPG